MSEWINTKDRLPDFRKVKEIITCDEDRVVCIENSTSIKKSKGKLWSNNVYYIPYWMPLPEVPK